LSDFSVKRARYLLGAQLSVTEVAAVTGALARVLGPDRRT
jgi:hypothetical protein